MISRILATVCACLAAAALVWGLSRDRAADRAETALHEARAARLVAEARAESARRRAELANFNAGIAHLALEDAERERASTAHLLHEWRTAYANDLLERTPSALLDLARRMRGTDPGAGARASGDAAAD